MASDDRRVRKTRKAISDALAKLLVQKPLNEISVREIADLADINRGTFYLHYRDVYDMVEQLQNEIFDKFNRIVAEFDPTEREISLFPVFVDLLGLLAENADLARVLISRNGDAAFVVKLTDAAREKCFADAKKVFNISDERKFGYFYGFAVAGCIGIAREWLVGGMTESASEVARISESLILGAARAFE